MTPFVSKDTRGARADLLRYSAWLCALLPLAVLVFAFVMIAQTVGTYAFWSAPVHEDGIRTFAATVFYFEHAARELPLDILLGIAIGAACAFGLRVNANARAQAWWIAAAITIATIALGSIATVGIAGLLDNLSQSHTRPGAALTLGSHWYFHLLSRGALLIAAISAGFLLRALTGRSNGTGGRTIWLTIAIFVGVSVIFSLTPSLFSAAFSDPVFLGHQARELLTHGLVTLPLGFLACMLVSDRSIGGETSSAPLILGAVLASLAAGIAIFIGLSAHLSGSATQGQSDDFRVLLYPHFFEHTFTYLITPFVAAAVFTSVGADES